MANISQEERLRRQQEAQAKLEQAKRESQAAVAPRPPADDDNTKGEAPAKPPSNGPVIVLKVPAWMQGRPTPLAAIQAGMQTWLDNQARLGLPLVISMD